MSLSDITILQNGKFIGRIINNIPKEYSDVIKDSVETIWGFEMGFWSWSS